MGVNMDSEGRPDYRDDFEDDQPVKKPVFTISLDPEAGRALRVPVPCDAADSSATDVQVDSFFNFTERFRSFPDLPDFGILYLSVPEAAELVTRDVRLSRPRILTSKDSSLLPPSRVESSEAAGLARFTKDIQTRLMRSVESKSLQCRSRPRAFTDFLNRGDEAVLPERTFLHFNDLVTWLREAAISIILIRRNWDRRCRSSNNKSSPWLRVSRPMWKYGGHSATDGRQPDGRACCLQSQRQISGSGFKINLRRQSTRSPVAKSARDRQEEHA